MRILVVEDEAELRDSLKQLGSDAYVELVPGACHGLPPGIFSKCARQMAEQYQKHAPATRP